MNFMVTYQKRNGDILLRARKTLSGMRVGDETSMGWTVLNIHYNYEGNYYTHDDYYRMVRHRQLKKKKQHRLVKYLIKQLQKIA